MEEPILGEFDAAGRAIHSGPGTGIAALVDWSPTVQRVVREVVRAYGRPDEITPSRLIWTSDRQHHPWKETVVHREGIALATPYPHEALLEQAAPFSIPLSRVEALHEALSDVAMADRKRGRIVVVSSRLDVNAEAWELARRVVLGDSPEEIRALFRERIRILLGGAP